METRAPMDVYLTIHEMNFSFIGLTPFEECINTMQDTVQSRIDSEKVFETKTETMWRTSNLWNTKFLAQCGMVTSILVLAQESGRGRSKNLKTSLIRS